MPVSDPGHLVHLSATDLSEAVRRGDVSCREVMEAHLAQIERLNPLVNAIVALRPREELLAEADEKDAMLRRGEHQGWMHGFPVAVKDLSDVAGLPTSKGFFADAPPAVADSLIVERMRAAGAIFVGKSNTPEFGLGSHTYNGVHGTTLNAWDQGRTAGGSSGGAAVAVALRMVPVADGSDFFGSLRNPTGWNNVLGLRPSLGRVPGVSEEVFVSQGGVEGPIARTAGDLRRLLETLAGPDSRDPMSLPDDLRASGEPAPDLTGRRVAWLGDLGGYLPVEPEVMGVCRVALHGLEDLGMEVVEVDGLPSYGTFRGTEDLWPTWLVWRHWLAGSSLRGVYEDPLLRTRMKPEAVFEVEGLLGTADRPPLTAAEVFEGSRRRSDLHTAMLGLFEDVDYVVLPSAQLFPFAATLDWPHEVAGRPMPTYHRWMEVTALGTLIGAPSLAMPAGFSAEGLPIGLQLVGRPQADDAVLDLAAAWEEVTDHHRRLPPLLAPDV